MMQTYISFEGYQRGLASMTLEERMKTIHYALRNIPRQYIEEYLQYSKDNNIDLTTNHNEANEWPE